MTLSEYLASLPHEEIYRMRKTSRIPQEILAPYEHRAFAREFAQESPFRAAISLPFAIPAYSAYKSLGFGNTRSPASLAEMLQGYKGLWEGLTQ